MAKFQHILVVDRQIGVAEVLRDILEHCGYRVSVAREDSDIGLILLKDGIDLLVSDVAVGSDAGIALADRAENIGIPSLLISGDLQRFEMLESGRHPFVAKPFRMTRFADAISRILARQKT